MAKHTHTKTSLAIIGGETLLGRDIRDLLESAELPASIRLITTADEGTVLTEQDGEPVPMTTLQAGELTSAKVVILAGSRDSSQKAFEVLRKNEAKPVVIDATAALEDLPAARLRAPMAEASRTETQHIQVIAHPAAVCLALFLRRLAGAAPISSCVALIFEPASERGQRGLDELQQQTVGLLSFQKLKKAVYDAQVSFNLLPRLGEDAPRQLEDIELQIDRHLASLLSGIGGIPMPSVRLIQAPVFHGYSFSLWVEFEQNPGVEAAASALKSETVEVRSGEEEPPSNVGAAGQRGITVGAITPDRNFPRALWFWMVADNLRITAENAVEVAREALA